MQRLTISWDKEGLSLELWVLSGTNYTLILRAGRAFQTNPQAKVKNYCNILLLYVKLSHISGT